MIVTRHLNGMLILIAMGDDQDPPIPPRTLIPEEFTDPPIPSLPTHDEDTLNMHFPINSLGPSVLDIHLYPTEYPLYSFLEPSKARKDHEPNVAKRTSFPDTIRSFRSPRKGGKR